MNSTILKTLVIYAVILPLAVLVGWMAVDLANWDRTSFAVFVAIVLVLLLPVLLKWHYPVLIFSWATSITIFFLPGEPALWMLMSAINFAMAILQRIMLKRPAFISTPSITAALLFLALVVLVTMQLRGGLGLRILGGSTLGGKGYIFLLAAVLGYFALTSQPIPQDRAKLYMGLFFLPGLITAGSTLIYYAGPVFYPLFLVFPVAYASVQAQSEFALAGVRVAGFAAAAPAVLYYLLAVHGIRGVLKKWWLGLLLLGTVALGTLGGYRSALLVMGLIFGVLFVVEGLLRSPLFPVMVLGLGLGFAALVPMAAKLPLSTQRTLSVLPLAIDPVVRRDAESSVDWRLELWRAMVPDLPKYFWLGKGYVLNPTDFYLLQQAALRGRIASYETFIATGDYHNGPLSVYVPFGAFGSLAWLIFLGVSLRALYLNLRYGPEELKTINRFLFSYLIARILFFFGFFGGFSNDLATFVGIVGLSVALNHGICRRPAPVGALAPVRFRGNMPLSGARPGLA